MSIIVFPINELNDELGEPNDIDDDEEEKAEDADAIEWLFSMDDDDDDDDDDDEEEVPGGVMIAEVDWLETNCGDREDERVAIVFNTSGRFVSSFVAIITLPWGLIIFDDDEDNVEGGVAEHLRRRFNITEWELGVEVDCGNG